ncbi:MAG TPA: YCF48-related protein [Flavobacteriales bacterium]|nr:hypothetical protein [Flavobacteriales bacterium]MCB0777947.1 hypothetical protein [Flavobacteriales bacterium]MCB0785836.1 hypothetical protein [Flavobacteriales bacterium]MCB0789557.1 hypothetical protein [Flavobacteriales bacterium]MCB0810678.1 hypothetical protein [Flavobacteriales bacterium]
MRPLVLVCSLFVPFVCFAQGSWQVLSASSLSWRFEDLFFVNDSVGWAVDGGGQILKTTDAGSSWTQQFYNSNYYFRSVEFFDEQVGFAGTLSSALFRTEDGGATWVDISASLPTVPAGICGMSVADDTTIYLTGIFYSPAYIMRSTDRGTTWTHTSMSTLAFNLVDVHFKNTLEGYLAGTASLTAGQGRPVVLRTTDGGNNWTVAGLGANQGERAWKIQFLNDSVGFASIEELSPDPQYLKTTDGGLSWTLQVVSPSIPTGTVQGVGFLTEEQGWLGGFNDLLFGTSDGGSTWSYQPSVGQSFNRFWRMNDSVMYVGGQQIYRYTDHAISTIIQVPLEPGLQGHVFELIGPNPVVGPASVRLTLVNDTYVEVTVRDLAGRRVATLFQGMGNKGELSVPWDATGSAAGNYLLSLYTYHGYQVIQVVVGE